MSSEDRNLSLADRYLIQTGQGKEPDMITRDQRFGLEARKKRLDRKGISLHEEYLFDEDAVRGSRDMTPEDSPRPFRASMTFRETRRIREYTFGGHDKKKLRWESPVTFYADIIDHRGREDFAVSCPGCGSPSLASALEKGCAYCGTRFAMEGLYPRISSCYFVEDVVWRPGLTERMKKRYGVIAGILFPVLSFLSLVFQGPDPDYPVWLQILGCLFKGAFLTAGMTAVVFMAGTWLMMGKVFLQAGSVLPMLGVNSSRRRLEERMRRYDPDFSVELFEGKMVSLLSAVLFGGDRENLSFYQGRDDLSGFDDLIGSDYRGGFILKEMKVEGGRIRVLARVFTDNVYGGGRITRKKERFLVRMERSADAVSDAGFSFHAVRCPSCGASFDAVHERHCPYCGTAYEAARGDWVITMIRKE
jgi:uncharacterized Zn-finger protein